MTSAIGTRCSLVSIPAMIGGVAKFQDDLYSFEDGTQKVAV